MESSILKLNRLALPKIMLLPAGPEYLQYMGASEIIGDVMGVMNENRFKWSLQESIDYIDKVISDHTDSAVLHTYRSSFYLQAGDYEKTIESLTNSIKYLPNHLHLKLNLLKTYVHFKKFDEVEKMIGLDPNIVNFNGGDTTVYVGDFLEFYISVSGFMAHLGDMIGLGEVMLLAEKYLTNKEDFMFFQMSTRSDFDLAMKNWMKSKGLG